MRPILVIGNRNYSSWSLRGWLAMRKAGVDFEVLRLPLDTSEFAERIGDYSPSHRVPVLQDEDQFVWESTAICEYANDRWADGKLLPDDVASRGWARSVMAEMHAGFTTLRARMPMNCRAENRRVEIDAALQSDIDRICAIWAECLAADREGPWLFGKWSLADAMYAPVALRFKSYAVDLPPAAIAYVETTLADPDIAEWVAAGRAETEIVEADEAGI